MSNDPPDLSARIERLRSIVDEDHERISGGDDPYKILNVKPSMTLENIESRYERYERFYRADNFRRFGDMDLTRKALDIRRAIGRAISAIHEMHEQEAEEPDEADESLEHEFDSDAAALGYIFFQDGLTYLQLGDLAEAENWFGRAVEINPQRGNYLAYYSYTSYRQRPYDRDIVERTREQLDRAVELDKHNPDVHVLYARFLMKMGELDEAYANVERVEELDPTHPMLQRLREKFAERSRKYREERAAAQTPREE